MRRLIDIIYFFTVLCEFSTVTTVLFGGHADLTAGGGSTVLTSGESDRVLLAINMVIACATVFLVFPKAKMILAMLMRLRYLLALYLLAAVSIIWSVDRPTTFRTGLYIFMFLVSTAYISTRFDNDKIIRLLGNSMVFLAALSVVWQRFGLNTMAGSEDYTGVFQSKNGLGIAMAIGVVALVAARRSWNLFRIGSIVLCFVMLIVSESETALISAIVPIAIFLYLGFNRRVRPVFLVAFLGACVIIPIAVSNLSGLFTEATGRNETLTGRTAIWALVLKQIASHPILGYGNEAFWTKNADTINEFITNGFKPGQAHNGYLEICLNLGVVGLVLSLLLLRDGLRRSTRLRRIYGSDAGVWMLMVTVIVLVHNVAESDFLKMSTVWFVFLVSYFSAFRIEYELEAEYLASSDSPGEQALPDEVPYPEPVL